MKSQKKNPRGRPTLYKPEYCDELISHMKEGYSFETFGARIGVAHDRVWKWAKKHKDFADAKKLASAQSQMFWERLGTAGALGKVKNFNATVWIFTMKNRFGWRDRHEIKETDDFLEVSHKKIMDYLDKGKS